MHFILKVRRHRPKRQTDRTWQTDRLLPLYLIRRVSAHRTIRTIWTEPADTEPDWSLKQQHTNIWRNSMEAGFRMGNWTGGFGFIGSNSTPYSREYCSYKYNYIIVIAVITMTFPGNSTTQIKTSIGCEEHGSFIYLNMKHATHMSYSLIIQVEQQTAHLLWSIVWHIMEHPFKSLGHFLSVQLHIHHLISAHWGEGCCDVLQRHSIHWKHTNTPSGHLNNISDI